MRAAQLEADRARQARENLKKTLTDQLNVLEDTFCAVFDEVEAIVGDWQDEQGFNQNTPLGMIALMHTELSEAVEALRLPPKETLGVRGVGTDQPFAPDNTPMGGYTHDSDPVAEELADCIIRIMHFGARFGHNVSGSIISKCIRNLHREKMHGKLA